VSPKRFELPDGLSEEEEREVLAALERYFSGEQGRPPPWVLQSRIAGARQGTLQARKLVDAPWSTSLRASFARRGADPFTGRGDAN
jgi:hypothetical protein